MRVRYWIIGVCMACLFSGSLLTGSSLSSASGAVLNPNPPSQPVKLIFVHHSSGGNWLADPAGNALGGDLGRALMNNHYFVSATNYGWTVGADAIGADSIGADSIGDRTDIGHWWEWYRGPNSANILAALYAENGQNFGDYGAWPRLAPAPTGQNEVILFKSCFANSALQGSPADPIPPIASNPLRGEDAGSEHMTVANAKGIYIDLLNYFRTRPDKLFVVIAAPPLTDATYSATARAFNNWLVNDWLTGYPLNNVAVFSLYNVLTTNGGNPGINDLTRPPETIIAGGVAPSSIRPTAITTATRTCWNTHQGTTIPTRPATVRRPVSS